MEPTFRQSMDWLHTWVGVLLGGLLFAIFWMGTLSVFDKEIDRWMAPMTRLALPESPISLDALRPSLDAASAAKAPFWYVVRPTDRQPAVTVAYKDNATLIRRYLDPVSKIELSDPGTLAGTGFLYPFHYMLHIRFAQMGSWLVGLAGMAMLALCVSGIVIHRKIFADFFTFRPEKQSRRAILDLHNVTGVIGLPFHIVITLSGLIIFYSFYIPSGWRTIYEDQQAFNADAFSTYSRERSNQPSSFLASLDAMTVEAERLWSGETPTSIAVYHPGDAAAYVAIRRPYDARVTAVGDVAYFDAATGTLLHEWSAHRPVTTAQRFIAGLHLIQFRHWTLRWIYFALGLSGCVMIATGFLFWLESRRKKHAQFALPGVRIVEGLTIGSTVGIVFATLAFFVTNRLLPLGTTFAGYERAALEAWAFYLVWIATFAHAWLRPARAWIEQCWSIAAFAVAAVVLNWITTGDHLVRSLAHRHLWPIAGMDLMLLMAAVIAALTARKLQRRAAGASASAANVRGAELHPAE